MKKTVFLFNVCILVLGVSLISIITFIKPTPSEEHLAVLPPREIYTGAWVGGMWDSKTKTLSISELTSFEQLLETKVAIANFFTEWTYLENPALVQTLSQLSDNGWTPMISSNPLFFDGCPKTQYSLYQTIALGHCDGFLKSAAANLRSFSHPVLFRFAWEMNHPDMWWSINKTESTPEEFVAAWRHIHDVFESEGADNVQFVLSFNTSSTRSVPYQELFPGDEYLEWVAIDGYNWGTAVEWSGWTSFEGVFDRSYQELTALSSKPIMLSEFGSTDVGGNKAAWYDHALNVQIPYKYHQIQAVVFFNEDKSANEGVDWRLESSEETVVIVRAALRNKLYSGQLGS